MTTFGDQVFQFGGAPVGASYHGWWGNDVWFVDDQDGNDDNLGNKPDKAKATIQGAVDVAGPHDTIYLRPRDLGGDVEYPGYSAHGYYTGNIATKTTQQGLSIIGTGGTDGSIGSNIQCMIEPTAASTSATISVRCPAVSIENLGVKQINESTEGGINATSTYNTRQAWGMTISNCFFKDFQSAGSGIATVVADTAHWTTIQHCIFRESDMGINFKSTEALIKAPTVKDCTFTGAAADIDCCILLGDCKSLLIEKCAFLSAKPTAGSRDIYIQMVGAASTGMISDCYFSHTSKTIAHFATIAGTALMVNCKGQDEEIIAT